MVETVVRAVNNAFIAEDRWRLWLSGLEMTLLITFFALLMGLVVGLFVSVIRVSHDTLEKPNLTIRILNRIVSIYVSIVRGIPVIVQVLLWSFVILATSRNHLLIGSLAFGFNSGAYVSEVFRGGILSIDKGQTEAGRSWDSVMCKP